MPTIKRTPLYAAALVIALGAARADADELFAAPSFETAKLRTAEWLTGRKVEDKAVLAGIESLWSPPADKPSAQALLQTVVDTFALADPNTQKLVEACSFDKASLVPPDGVFLDEDGGHPFFSANMRLFYGKYLAQRKMYDEALRVLEKVDPVYAVDPASFLYFKAVSEHQLLMKSQGLATIERLLKNTADVPVRYSTVATLMQYDLEALEEKTLDEIARKMRDSERRLELARSGPKAQKVQSEIIAGLDEIIEKIEQQSGGGGGGGGSGGNKNEPGSNPANDSVIKGATADGKVDKKKLSNQGGWGDLDPKEQAKAKNDINQKFPSHYQKQNEEYFKKLAKRRAK